MTQIITQSKKILLKKLPTLLFVSLLVFSGTTFSSCNRKTGCKMNESQVKTNRKGELSSKKGSTNLLPKKLRGSKKKRRKK